MQFIDRKKILLAFLLPFIYTMSFASTKTWTGLANDGNWSSADNWNDNQVPVSSDDVVLDNSSVSDSYTVVLPDNAVVVKSVTISPSANNIIELDLPSSNTNSPAFTSTGSSYGLTINDGGIFKNSSGASKGYPVDVSDSIRINNGGKYIHNTPRSHANNVAILSRMAGTEKGIFEFDVPGTQSFAVSLSNRIYGTLMLSANATTNNQKNYSGIGTNPLTIRGDLRIGDGVVVSLNLRGQNGNIDLGGDLIQDGGTLNLASGPDSSVLKIKGDVIQQSSGVINETSTGIPVIELAGERQQNISFEGSITDSIILRIDNSAGVLLNSPLSLPYKLEMVDGNIISSTENLLILQDKAVVSVDSSSSNSSFIDGPLKKEGLSDADYFIFPVGKANEFRWAELKNATGNFVVEYKAANAREISNELGAGIDHISTHGYWAIEPDESSTASAKVELSFSDVSASGVTDMATLRTAQLSSGVWKDRSNLFTTGTAGSAGSVVSEDINFESSANNFVLASTVPNENPLPVVLIYFSGGKKLDGTELNWKLADIKDVERFELWVAGSDNIFTRLATIDPVFNETEYKYYDEQNFSGVRYYKLQVIEKNGHSSYSKIVSLAKNDQSLQILSLAPNPVENYGTLLIKADEKTEWQIMITDIGGKMVARRTCNVVKGKNSIACNFSSLAAGVYVITCFDKKGRIASLKFIKK